MPEFITSAAYENKFEKDPNAILINVHSEEQEESYGCGPAVLTDILKTLGKNVSQKEITQQAAAEVEQVRPNDSILTIADVGTPTEVMENILKKYGAEFQTKKPEIEINEQTILESEKYLDNMLALGDVIICAVQTIPEYGEKRNIDEDGHYIIVCGKVNIDDKKYYITVDPMFHRYQRLSNEGSVYRFHKGDDIEVGSPKSDPVSYPGTTDTRSLDYPAEILEKFGIDPSKYGLRLIAATNLMDNWKDVSGFGDRYNFYGIAVKIGS